jgi:hypothetical protein
VIGVALVVILVVPVTGSLLLVMMVVTGDEIPGKVMCVEDVRE